MGRFDNINLSPDLNRLIKKPSNIETAFATLDYIVDINNVTCAAFNNEEDAQAAFNIAVESWTDSSLPFTIRLSKLDHELDKIECLQQASKR